MDARQVHPVDRLARLLVDGRSADDERVALLGFFQGLSDTRHEHHSRHRRVSGAANDDVFPIRQGLADAVERFSAHDDGVTGGQALEEFEVGRKMPGQLVVMADDAVFGDGDDVVDQTATGALMPG